MKIDVQTLSRTPGEVLPVKLEIQASELDLSADYRESLQDIAFDGSISCIEHGVFRLTGTLTVVRIGNCDRCLAPARQNLKIEIDEQFRRSAGLSDDEPEEYYGYVGHMINIDQAIRDNLLLSMPGQLLCRESCLGFCPVCGRDLNEGPCQCQAEPAAGSPFAKLSKLLQDDEDVLRT
ncbi:MAG: DUF177 domain-containing protein [Eubacteriales bacterium]|jgi:uncharacterized protein|nr:DUF177 domain-containing protein [Eubacteriales bacterium]MDD3197017.1 DUF177 domain-containing protein [Eubacteriales bacterium]MDD4681792.1 DUF177 domain-containing protein [Eubacteriales bacterium]